MTGRWVNHPGGRSEGSQGCDNGFATPEEVRFSGRDQGDGVRSSETQGPGKKKIAATKRTKGSQRIRGVPPGGTVIHRPAVTKLWVSGRASEDRGVWAEEVGAHCEKCYDDKMETSEVQAERIPKMPW